MIGAFRLRWLGSELNGTPIESGQLYNTSGALQGGLLATLADVAGGQLGMEYLKPGTAMTTSDLVIRYLRPIRQGSALAVPKVLRAGRRSLVMQIDIFGDSDSELAATATVNFAIIDRPADQQDAPAAD
jgi:uncharacterized protein (TIGR00369 family)